MVTVTKNGKPFFYFPNLDLCRSIVFKLSA